jgi:hypothetical protein
MAAASEQRIQSMAALMSWSLIDWQWHTITGSSLLDELLID